MPWLKQNFDGGKDTSARYMKLADPANFARGRNLLADNPDLSIREALKAIKPAKGWARARRRTRTA
ncbi:hypothetical protein GSI01S_29_00110 [Gordonia sihwensis NBRC 108236]|uniref:Uncharacterized protein n=1 Tax=Gordonia sihwensis NBRC 108236 TaxID=1223544 RepID=L7LPZ3_9ACTN|nr:hypothetical protein GSI01S_29_00110 [Gordonia sihwensis NBRC 108236]